MKDTLTKNKALEGKKISEYSNQDFWDLAIDKYRASKMVRKLINKKGHYDFNGFSEITGYSRHYIYQVMAMNIKPSDDFIQRLKQIGGEQ